MGEYPLRGGSVNTVVRAGDTVRRRPAGRFVHELLGFFDRCWRGIQAGAVAGDPAMVRLRNDGAVLKVQAAFLWVAGHRAELEVL